MRRDTDCDTDIDRALVINTRKQKLLNKTKKRKQEHDSDLNDLAIKCLKRGETGEVNTNHSTVPSLVINKPKKRVASSTDLNRLVDECLEDTSLSEVRTSHQPLGMVVFQNEANDGLQNDVYLTSNLPMNKTSSYKKLEESIPKQEAPYVDINNYFNPEEEEFAAEQEKYAHSGFTLPEQTKEPINIGSNQADQVLQLSCSSCSEVFDKLQIMQNTQNQQNEEIVGLKAVVAMNVNDTKAIRNLLERIHQDTQSVLSNFQEVEDNSGIDQFGFRFPITSVNELERLESELGVNSKMKSTLVILNFILFEIRYPYYVNLAKRDNNLSVLAIPQFVSTKRSLHFEFAMRQKY